jgi:YD repeat-containing protein
MTSQTNPAGVTTYYEYDPSERLVEVDNTDKHLIAYYDYNYQLIPELSVSPTSLNYSSDGGDLTVNVTSNINWTTTNTGSLINTVSPSSGSGNSTITINVHPNNTTSSRSGTIKIEDDSGSGLPDQTINISQAGITPTITLSKSMVYLYGFDYDDVDVTFNVGITWYVDYFDGFNWLDVNYTGGASNGTFYIDVYSLPPMGQTWEAQLVVQGGGITRYVTILLFN